MERKEINRMLLTRLGIILSNFTILGLVYMLLTALMPVLSFIYLLVVAIILILAIFPWIFSGFQLDLGKIADLFNEDLSQNVISIFNAYLPYVFGVSVAFAVLSAVILIFDKNQKHVARIIVSVAAVVIGVVAMIIRASGVSA